MAKRKIKNMSVTEIMESISHMPRESLKRIIELHGDNREVLIAVLKFSGFCLQYCNITCKHDKELVTVAVTQNGGALRYADPRFRLDPELVKVALKTVPDILEIVDIRFRNDPEYIKIATDVDVRSLQFASMSIRNNYLFIRDLVLLDGRAYTYAGINLLNCQPLAYIALTTKEILSYPLVSHLTRIADLCIFRISMLLEVAHTHKKVDMIEDWYAAEHHIPKKYHSILEFVLNTYIDDTTWTYVRQAILIDPEPFLNPNHVLRQLTQTTDDLRAISESILYDDFLKFKCETHDSDNSVLLTFDII